MARAGIPAVGDLLESSSVVSPYNHAYTIACKRFKIIDDYTLSFTTGGHLTRSHQKTYNQQVPVAFTGTTAAIASSGPGAVYCLVLPDTAAVPGTLQLGCRLRFTDE